MLALVEAPRIIAAATTSPRPTPINGLSRANQIGCVFMLCISSIPGSTFQQARSLLRRTNCRDNVKVRLSERTSCISRSRRGKLFRSESDRIHARDFFHWRGLACFSVGKDRLSLRKRYAGHYCINSALTCSMDHFLFTDSLKFSRDHCCSPPGRDMPRTTSGSSEERR